MKGSARLCAIVLLGLLFSLPTLAGDYLAKGHPDGIELLAPPPPPGSAEEAADLNTVRAVVENRSKAETNVAMKDSGLAFALFAPAIGPEFSLEKLPKTRALLETLKTNIQEAIDTPKNHFRRLRPYQMDTNLNIGKPEPSFGYPSGHSTRGTVYALVLAQLFPEKAEAILAIGRQIGWDRVVIAKHFPTDIYAGRVLGQAIVHEFASSPAFERDLAEAKAEVAAQRAEIRGQRAEGLRVAEPVGAK